MVGDEGAGGDGRILRHARLRHQAARRLGQDIAAGTPHPRPPGTPRTGLAEDYPGIYLLQFFEAQAAPVQHAGTIVGQQDVVALHQALDDLDRLGLAQVERDAALAAVHGDEVVRDLRVFRFRAADHFGEHPAAGVSRAALFDLGHGGSEIGQEQRRKGSLDFLSDLQHFDSFKRFGHPALSLSSSP